LPTSAPRPPIPLVVFFHGYGGTGEEQARAFGLYALSDKAGFALAVPDGTPDTKGRRFWNATDACCNLDDLPVDDVAYTRFILDDAAKRFPVDMQHVYVMGFSNGGFLAQRVACDLASRVSAVVSIAGAAWADSSRCTPSEPVSVLEIHGSADQTVRPEGGFIFDIQNRRYPSLAHTLSFWAAKDACGSPLAATGRRLDFEASLGGAETQEEAYSGCAGGVSVAWWNVVGAGHLLQPTPAGMEAAWRWMAEHAKSRPRRSTRP
jgi:polyhydroxybutyrate depolymerase